MLSRGVDVGFPSEIVISLVFFITFLLLNVYFHLFRVFLHSFFESPHFLTLILSFCTKISPDHVTVTSRSKWRLTVNFLKNSHSFSEYSIFTYLIALILCLLLPAGYPVYDQSFHRPPFQPQADFFQHVLIFHDFHVRWGSGYGYPCCYSTATFFLSGSVATFGCEHE